MLFNHLLLLIYENEDRQCDQISVFLRSDIFGKSSGISDNLEIPLSQSQCTEKSAELYLMHIFSIWSYLFCQL